MKLWIELTIESMLVAVAGVLTYNLCRLVYGMPETAATFSAAAAVLLVVVAIYSGHRLRRVDLLALPASERLPVAWRLIRCGLRATLLALLTACCGYVGLYLMRGGNVVLGLLVMACSVLSCILALIAASRAWREIRARPGK